jgi:hypothetical protein
VVRVVRSASTTFCYSEGRDCLSVSDINLANVDRLSVVNTINLYRRHYSERELMLLKDASSAAPLDCVRRILERCNPASDLQFWQIGSVVELFEKKSDYAREKYFGWLAMKDALKNSGILSRRIIIYDVFGYDDPRDRFLKATYFNVKNFEVVRLFGFSTLIDPWMVNDLSNLIDSVINSDLYCEGYFRFLDESISLFSGEPISLRKLVDLFSLKLHQIPYPDVLVEEVSPEEGASNCSKLFLPVVGSLGRQNYSFQEALFSRSEKP